MFYKISCIEDFDAFAREKSNLLWSCGLPLNSELMRNALASRSFPIYLEIDAQNFVLVTNSTPKNATIYLAKDQPISLMVDKRAQGVYFVDENGKEIFYTLQDFLNEPEAFERAVRDQAILKVGDKVKIIDLGQTYTTYYQWFSENNVSIDIAARYAFEQDVPATGEEYKVVAVGKHECGHIMYAISTIVHASMRCPSVYLVNEEGVVKV